MATVDGDVIPLEELWWLLAVATFGVGDALTTVAGTRRAGLVERSPVVRRVAGRTPSIPALVGLKVTAFLIAAVLSRAVPPGTYRTLVPAGIAVVGTLATGFNLWAIATHGEFEADATGEFEADATAEFGTDATAEFDREPVDGPGGGPAGDRPRDEAE